MIRLKSFSFSEIASCRRREMTVASFITTDTPRRGFRSSSVLRFDSDCRSATASSDCALVPVGTDWGVVCWGGNGNGQLGNATTTESLYPVPVFTSNVGTPPPRLLTVGTLGVGGYHSCATSGYLCSKSSRA